MDANKSCRSPVKNNILIIVLQILTIIFILLSFVLIKNYFTAREDISQLNEKFDLFISEQREQNKLLRDMLVNTNYYLGKLPQEETEVIEEMPSVIPEGDTEQMPEIEKPGQLPEKETEIHDNIFISQEKDEELLSSTVSVYAGNNFGSGFVVSESGHILTNYHIIGSFRKIEVDFYDGTIALANVIKYDKDKDIALIRVIGRNLQYIELGDSDKIIEGQTILALSHPSGYSISLSQGNITKLDVREGFFEFSAPLVNTGSSGGAIVDMDSNVQGMIIHTREGEKPFAIYSNELKQFLSGII